MGELSFVVAYSPPMQIRSVDHAFPSTLLPVCDIATPNDFRIGTATISTAPLKFEKLIPGNVSGRKLHRAEDLQARAAIFERGTTQVVLVGVDVFGLGSWEIDVLNRLSYGGIRVETFRTVGCRRPLGILNR